MGFGALAWTQTAMLAGLAMLALPVIAHLLNRGARHRVVFPSLRLLLRTHADQARVHRPRRWLLLLLRMAAVTLLTLAFARPVWRNRAGDAAPADAPGAVVIVADVSASTAQLAEGVQALDALRTTGARLLADLVTGRDRANLITAGARTESLFPAPTANLPAVLAELEALRPTTARADLAGALALAGRQLAAHAGPRRLVLLTDRQRSNWAELEQSLTGLPADAQLVVVPLAGEPPDNVALAAPTLDPALPAAGQPATFAVQVANRGAHPRVAPVLLRVEDRAAGEELVTLAAGETREVAFAVRFDTPGFHRVEAGLPHDALAADNRVYLAATVVERAPVVVVGDDSPDEPGGASYFLVRALSPRGDARDALRARHLRGVDVEAGQLADAAGVFLAAPADLPDDSLAALADYLARSGGVWIFAAGDGMDALAARLDAAVPGGCLPWPCGPVRRATEAAPLRIAAEGDWHARLLRTFQPMHRESLSELPFLRAREAGAPHAGARVLLAFGDGLPALGVRETPGGGRCYLANFALDRAAGALPRHGFFVALLHSAVQELQQAVRRREELYAGRPLHLVTARAFDSAGATPHVRGPGGEILADATVRVNRQDLTVGLTVAADAGFYDVQQGEVLLGRAAVNLDPRESALERMDPEALAAALRRAGARNVRGLDAHGEDIDALGLRGRPLWGWLAAAALGLLLTESALLGVWRR